MNSEPGSFDEVVYEDADSIIILTEAKRDTTPRPPDPVILKFLKEEAERVAYWEEWLKNHPPTDAGAEGS